jgi:hypothetical protein
MSKASHQSMRRPKHREVEHYKTPFGENYPRDDVDRGVRVELKVDVPKLEQGLPLSQTAPVWKLREIHAHQSLIGAKGSPEGLAVSGGTPSSASPRASRRPPSHTPRSQADGLPRQRICGWYASSPFGRVRSRRPTRFDRLEGSQQVKEFRSGGNCPASLQRLLACQVPNDRDAIGSNSEPLDAPILCAAQADENCPELRLSASAHLPKVHTLGQHHTHARVPEDDPCAPD